MPSASYIQTSFRGGEFSPTSHGAMHDPLYKAALDTCQNYIVLEEDSLARRPGTKFGWPTKAGGVARAVTFKDATSAAYVIEAGGGYFRFGKNRQLLLEAAKTVTSISTATPASVAITSHGYSTGNYGVFSNLSGGNILRNRQFAITVTGASAFTIADPMSGSFVGTASSDFVSGQFQRVYEITNPYDSGEIMAVYFLQDQNQMVCLHGSVTPQLLSRTAGTDTFAINAATFTDGPYLDPPTDGTTLTPDATSGTITLHASATTAINGGQGFLITDVGRHVRLFSPPPNWALGTPYSTGDLVTYQGEYYTAIKGSTGKTPNTQYTYWSVSPTAATWVWGIITNFTDSTHVVIATQAFDDGTTPALLNTNAIVTWQLGVYSATTGYASVGVFHEGRLWLASPAYPNRFDASKTDKHFNFTPTSPDGTIADDNAVSVVAEAQDAEPILWMVSTDYGIVAGTPAGEWNIRASQLNDPITPTSIQISRATKLGCANVRPAETPTSLAVVHRPGRKVFEYKRFIDTSAYLQTINAVPLSLRARHLMETGIAQVEYQADPYPVVWARRNDGELVGCTYLRNPQQYIAGWHKHPLGGGTANNDSDLPALVQSMAVCPTPDGLSEDLWCVVGRKIPGILAPDATPNPPITPTQTVTHPALIASGVTYDGMVRMESDDSAGQLIMAVQQLGTNRVAIKIVDYNNNLVIGAPIDTDGAGGHYGTTIPVPLIGFAPSGTKLFVIANEADLFNSKIIVLNRSTLAYVQSNTFGNTFQQLMAVSNDEQWVIAFDLTFVYAYHVADNVQSRNRWDSLGGNAPNAQVNDAAFDASGNLWLAENDGTLEKYTISWDSVHNAATLNKVATYHPHTDGLPIIKLTYNPAHNHMLLWYRNGSAVTNQRMTRFALSGNTVYGDYTYPFLQKADGLAGVTDWYIQRSNWHNTTIYTDTDYNNGSPQVWFFNPTSGDSFSKLGTYWPPAVTGAGAYWGAEGSPTYYSNNSHTLFAAWPGYEQLSYDVYPFAEDDIGLGDGTIHYMEFVSPLLDFDETDPELAMFWDSGRQNSDDTSAVTVSNGTVTMTGLHYLEGETVGLHVNGVDGSDVVVQHGQIVFPAPSGVTQATDLSISIGYSIDAEGALLPPAEAGGGNGPSAFHTKRNHKAAFLVHNTQDFWITEDGRNFAPDKLINEMTNRPTVAPALFSGKTREAVQGADYSYEGKITWRQKRGYPGTVLAAAGFLVAQDV